MRTDTDLIVGLRDWSRDTSRLIPPKTRAASTMDGAVPSQLGLFKDPRGYYHTSGTVGIGWLKDDNGKIKVDPITGRKQALMIRPRFNLNPWDMLVQVMNDPEYELYTADRDSMFFEIYTDEPLIPVPCEHRGGELLAAISFLKECERICKKKLRSEMSFEEANFNGRVVGNLQVPKHLKYNVTQAREDRIYCRYPIFSVDTLENRILKAALKKAHAIFRDNNIHIVDINRMFNYCENALKEVRSITISRADFNRVNVTGFNSFYRNVIQLAKTVILKNGVNDLGSDTGNTIKYVIPYSINMETLFEFYVRASLKKSIKALSDTKLVLDEYRTPTKNPLHTTKTCDRNTYLMQNYVPDIALVDNSGDEPRYVAVFDVKYQNSLGGVYADSRRHNSHQLLFYTLLLNVDKCGFIFPSNQDYSSTETQWFYELEIQKGSAMDGSTRAYSQWIMNEANCAKPKTAEQLLRYVQGMPTA